MTDEEIITGLSAEIAALKKEFLALEQRKAALEAKLAEFRAENQVLYLRTVRLFGVLKNTYDILSGPGYFVNEPYEDAVPEMARQIVTDFRLLREGNDAN